METLMDLFKTGSYGRIELATVYQRNILYGLSIATALSFTSIGTYHGIQWLERDEGAPTVKVRILKYSELGPPPSLTQSAALPTVAVAGPSVRPTIGIPVPVPDAEVNPEQTIATQQELSAVQTPTVEDKSADAGVAITQDIQIGDEPGMDEFVPVEKEPQVVREVRPVYPELARKAGVEGIVWVKVLVGKDGRPKKAVVIKEIPSEIFNEPALKAAMGYLFTPALMNTGPVQVWVVLRFRFRFQETSS